MKQSTSLLNQIIEMAEVQAKELDAFNLQRHKASKTIGENSVVFYLKQLRELLQEEDKLPKTITVSGKTLSVALGDGSDTSFRADELGNFSPYEQTR